MSLSSVERVQYTAVIDGILANSDLQTISAKKIRRGLQDVVPEDLSAKKTLVQELILERFDHASSKAAPEPIHTTEAPATNGNHNEVKKEPNEAGSATPSSGVFLTPSASTPSASVPKSEPESDSDVISPPKKKRKQAKAVDDDAEMARKLQAQEDRSARATRGGNKKMTKKIAKKPRKKSEKKVKANDDSGLEEIGSDGEVKEKPKKGGFHKQYHLSVPLADLVGEHTLSRPQVVKKIWEYIKARDLQDPSDKRQILCDEKLQLVFKQDKVHMFTMNKILSKQLYDVEENE